MDWVSMKNERIDYHAVAAAHLVIHGRLLNWGRWVKPGRGGGGLQPMFRQYRSTETVSDPQAAFEPIDALDAVDIEKIICNPGFPEKNRSALQWHYVYWFIDPRKMCRNLAVSEAGLQELIDGGRSMVKNRLRT